MIDLSSSEYFFFLPIGLSQRAMMYYDDESIRSIHQNRGALCQSISHKYAFLQWFPFPDLEPVIARILHHQIKALRIDWPIFIRLPSRKKCS